MAEKFNVGGEVVAGDWNNVSTKLRQEFYDRVLKHMMGGHTNAFFSAGFTPSRNPGNLTTQVLVLSGFGMMDNPTAPATENRNQPLFLPTDKIVNAETPPASGQKRIDNLIVRAISVDKDPIIKKFRPAVGQAIQDVSFFKTFDWDVEFVITQGVPAASNPSAPAVPSGHLKIAELSMASSGLQSVKDTRNLLPNARVPTLSGNTEYDYIIGQHGTHGTLQALIDFFQSPGVAIPRNIAMLITEDQTLNDSFQISSDMENWKVVFKPGVRLLSSGAAVIEILGPGATIIDATIDGSNLSGNNDKGISVGAHRCSLIRCRFVNMGQKKRIEVDGNGEYYADVVYGD